MIVDSLCVTRSVYLPGQQSELLLQHDLQLLSLFGEPVVHAVTAVAVLQHQPEICHKLCDGVVLLADKLLLHSLQTHGLSLLSVAPAPDAPDAMLSLQVTHREEEGASDPLVLVQEEPVEYPISLLDLVVHVILKAGVGGDTDLGQGEVTAGQLHLVPDRTNNNALGLYHSCSGVVTVTQGVIGDGQAGAFSSTVVPLWLR